MNKIIVIIGLLLAVSIGINIWFFSGKGIEINNFNYTRQYQYQQQFQGQLLINQWAAQGNIIEWKLVKCLLEDVPEELNRLHPISSFYCKIILPSTSAWVDIIYPEIFIKMKEELKK